MYDSIPIIDRVIFTGNSFQGGSQSTIASGTDISFPDRLSDRVLTIRVYITIRARAGNVNVQNKQRLTKEYVLISQVH